METKVTKRVENKQISSFWGGGNREFSLRISCSGNSEGYLIIFQKPVNCLRMKQRHREGEILSGQQASCVDSDLKT